jgi:hypothetical protein
MSVALFFTLQCSTVTLNEPTYFDLEIRNNSSEAIAVDLGHNYKSSLVFSVETTEGAVIDVPPLSSDGLGRIGRVQIEPRGQYKRKYLLDEWYAFHTPGDYSIRPGISTPIVSASGEVVHPNLSPGMKLTVTRRDPQKLATICESLIKKMLETTDVEEISDASLALSYVQDPVAVKYVREGLKQGKLMWQYAITGLARIGNQEAVDLLTEIMSRGNDEAGAALARFHLEALSKRAEPDMRETILKSLQR